ncbi:MAG: cupin domain-containing protein [Methylotenera sp.]|nr:cupin domain-containing protein [Methylotenera sp.]
MSKILVEKPSVEKLASLGVTNWSTWSKEVSEFPWTYSSQEIAYILEGEVTVTPNDGSATVSFGAGDLVTFPVGLSCTWHVKKALRKHYKFS